MPWVDSRVNELRSIIAAYIANGTNISDIPLSVLPYPYEPTIWQPPDPAGFAKVLACLVIIIVGSLGNIGIILTVALTKALWKTQNIFMINLAVADAIICVFCVVPYALEQMTAQVYILGEFMCKFNGFIQMSCLISSVLTLSAISGYFFLKCVFPFQLKKRKSHNFLLITTIWLASFLVSVPLVIVKRHTTLQWRDFNETHCTEYWPAEVYYDKYTGKNIKHKPLREAYFLVISITLFFVPAMIMFALNSWILVRFWTEKALEATKEIKRINQEKKNLRNRNVTIRFLIIFLAFIICWTPAQVVMLYDLSRNTPDGLTPLPEWFPEFNWFAYYMAYANSLLNPIIYSFYNMDLKMAFLKMVHCAAQRKKAKRNRLKGVRTASVADHGAFRFAYSFPSENSIKEDYFFLEVSLLPIDWSIITYTTSIISNVSRRLSRSKSSSSATESEMCETANNPTKAVRKGPCTSDGRQRVESV